MNQNFNDFETEGRRLGILRILLRRAQFTTNEYSLNDELQGAYAHHISRDKLHGDIAWLEEQGLVIAQQPRAGWILGLLRSMQPLVELLRKRIYAVALER